MEIKKYVLLDNNNILEISSPNNLNNDDLEYFAKHIRKTSDNILDLVEVGDLVEILYTGNDKYYKLEVVDYDESSLETTHMTITTKSFKGFTYSKDNSNVKLPFCKAIYKNQSNGDYKKYEVKE